MEPIVSPWIIYLIELLDNIKNLICILVSMIIVLSIPYGGVYVEISHEYADMVKYFKKVAIIVVTLLCIYSIIPSKETAISMIVASFITPDNINLTENHLIELINRIIEAGKITMQK